MWWRREARVPPLRANCADVAVIRAFGPPDEHNCAEVARRGASRRGARRDGTGGGRCPCGFRSGPRVVSRHDRRMPQLDAFDPSRPFTRAEGIAAGLTPWQLRSPQYAHPFHDTYIARTASRTLATRVRAAVLGAPETAVISHETAAALWGGVVPESTWIHLTVPPRETFVRAGVRTHRLIGNRPIAHRLGLRLTTPEQTFIDLAGRPRPRSAGHPRRPAGPAEGDDTRTSACSDERLERTTRAGGPPGVDARPRRCRLPAGEPTSHARRPRRSPGAHGEPHRP